ncbi:MULTISPECIES: glycosyltransferase family 2 protein [Halomonadaceae]|uniref:Glycosyltransferase n=2 Tax=Bacteria TaxID=2 RepID=A0A9X4YBT4_9GAMM|nr:MULTISPECIES: glycosyltransferase family 2 protein [Halomonas]MYL26183.1 glycosyltransferase [Halomonas utahensis]MYL73255.1 glycosyltransferase [Halomonas sp. 22501_18_FS]
MNVTVLFTTYNSPKWLEKVLWGFSVQTHRDFDIIIADDGSTDETRQLIDRMRSETGIRIKHVWHEDHGFQKCEILNKAILQVESDYIIFTDGDCIPRADFVEEHLKCAKPGCFLTGSVARLPMSTSEHIGKEDITSGACFNWDWLVENGLLVTRKNMKLRARKYAGNILNHLTPARTNFTGCNASAWTKDVIAVNGFDQRMSHGGLDREFGVRLKNLGIKGKHVRYNAQIIHLDHARGYSDPENIRKNKALRIHNAKRKIKITEYGLNLVKDQAVRITG